MKYKKENKAILILAFFLGLAFPGSPAMAKTNATISKLQGNVDVFSSAKNESFKGKSGMPLVVGDKIVTIGKDSSVDINFPTGDMARIVGDSTLEIKEARFKKKASRIRLKLFKGKVFNVVKKKGRGSDYETETNSGVASVRGTIWSAETDGDGKDVFMVKEGNVAVVNPEVTPEKGVLVSELKKTVVQSDKAPSKPVPLTPEEIAMFDVLEDIFEDIKDALRDEIREELAEEISEGFGN